MSIRTTRPSVAFIQDEYGKTLLSFKLVFTSDPNRGPIYDTAYRDGFDRDPEAYEALYYRQGEWLTTSRSRDGIFFRVTSTVYEPYPDQVMPASWPMEAGKYHIYDWVMQGGKKGGRRYGRSFSIIDVQNKGRKWAQRRFRHIA